MSTKAPNAASSGIAASIRSGNVKGTIFEGMDSVYSGVSGRTSGTRARQSHAEDDAMTVGTRQTSRTTRTNRTTRTTRTTMTTSSTTSLGAVRRKIGRVAELSEIDEMGNPLDGYDYSQHFTSPSDEGIFLPAPGASSSSSASVLSRRSRKEHVSYYNGRRVRDEGDIFDAETVYDDDASVSSSLSRHESMDGVLLTRQIGKSLNLPASMLPALPEDAEYDEEGNPIEEEEIKAITLHEDIMPTDLKEALDLLDDLESDSEETSGDQSDNEKGESTPEKHVASSTATDDVETADPEAENSVLVGSKKKKDVKLRGKKLEPLDDNFVLQAMGLMPIPEWKEGEVPEETTEDEKEVETVDAAGVKDEQTEKNVPQVYSKAPTEPKAFTFEEQLEKAKKIKEFDFEAHVQRLMEAAEGQFADMDDFEGMEDDEFWIDDEEGDFEFEEVDEQEELQRYMDIHKGVTGENRVGGPRLDDAALESLMAQYDDEFLGELDPSDPRLRLDGSVLPNFASEEADEVPLKSGGAKSKQLDTVDEEGEDEEDEGSDVQWDDEKDFSGDDSDGFDKFRAEDMVPDEPKGSFEEYNTELPEHFSKLLNNAMRPDRVEKEGHAPKTLEDLWKTGGRVSLSSAAAQRQRENALDGMTVVSRMSVMKKMVDKYYDEELSTETRDLQLAGKHARERAREKEREDRERRRKEWLELEERRKRGEKFSIFEELAKKKSEAEQISEIAATSEPDVIEVEINEEPKEQPTSSFAFSINLGALPPKKSAILQQAQEQAAAAAAKEASSGSKPVVPFGYVEVGLSAEEKAYFPPNWTKAKEKSEHDAMTVVSTYSNLENHPTTLLEGVAVDSTRLPPKVLAKRMKKLAELTGVPEEDDDENAEGGSSNRSVARSTATGASIGSFASSVGYGPGGTIRLSKKTGLPVGTKLAVNGGKLTLAVAPIVEEDEDGSDGEDNHAEQDEASDGSDDSEYDEDYVPVAPRKKGEIAEERRARKERVKEEKRLARELKKKTKEVYKYETLRQKNREKKLREEARGQVLH